MKVFVVLILLMGVVMVAGCGEEYEIVESVMARIFRLPQVTMSVSLCEVGDFFNLKVALCEGCVTPTFLAGAVFCLGISPSKTPRPSVFKG